MTPTYPRINPDRDKEYCWYLAEPVAYYLRDGREITIPEGFRFDGHSVPRLFWVFTPPFGLDIYASLVHDYLCKYPNTLSVKRKQADAEYKALMFSEAYQMSALRSFLMTSAVRLWGFTTRDIFGL